MIDNIRCLIILHLTGMRISWNSWDTLFGFLLEYSDIIPTPLNKFEVYIFSWSEYCVNFLTIWQCWHCQITDNAVTVTDHFYLDTPLPKILSLALWYVSILCFISFINRNPLNILKIKYCSSIHDKTFLYPLQTKFGGKLVSPRPSV